MPLPDYIKDRLPSQTREIVEKIEQAQKSQSSKSTKKKTSSSSSRSTTSKSIPKTESQKFQDFQQQLQKDQKKEDTFVGPPAPTKDQQQTSPPKPGDSDFVGPIQLPTDTQKDSPISSFNQLPTPIESSLMSNQGQRGLGQLLYTKRLGSESSKRASSSISSRVSDETTSEQIPSNTTLLVHWEDTEGNQKTAVTSNIRGFQKEMDERDGYITKIENYGQTRTYYETPSRSKAKDWYKEELADEWAKVEPIQRPEGISQQKWNQYESQYRSGEITRDQFIEQTIHQQALQEKPDYYRFIPDSEYADTITNLSLGRISEEEARNTLQSLNDIGQQQAPKEDVEEWAEQYLDWSEKEGIQNISQLRKSEPAIVGISYDKDAPKGQQFIPKYDYVQGVKDLRRQWGDDWRGKVQNISTDITSLATNFPTTAYSSIGSAYRLLNPFVKPKKDELGSIVQDVAKERYQTHRAFLETERTKDPTYAGFDVALSPTTTDILIPSGIGYGIRGATPFVRGAISKSRTVAPFISSVAKSAPRVATGTKYALMGGLTSPIWAPPLTTGIREYQGLESPGTTAESLGRMGTQLLSFGAGSNIAGDKLKLPSKRIPGWTKEQSLYQMGRQAPTTVKTGAKSFLHALRNPRGYYEVQTYGRPGTASSRVVTERVSPFGRRTRVPQSDFYKKPNVINKQFVMKDTGTAGKGTTYGPRYTEKTIGHYMKDVKPPQGQTSLTDYGLRGTETKLDTGLTARIPKKPSVQSSLTEYGLRSRTPQGIGKTGDAFVREPYSVYVKKGTSPVKYMDDVLSGKTKIRPDIKRPTLKHTDYNPKFDYIKDMVTYGDMTPRPPTKYSASINWLKRRGMLPKIQTVQPSLKDFGLYYPKRGATIGLKKVRLGPYDTRTLSKQPWNRFWSSLEKTPTKISPIIRTSSTSPSFTSGGGIIGRPYYGGGTRQYLSLSQPTPTIKVRPRTPTTSTKLPIQPAYRPTVPITPRVPVTGYLPQSTSTQGEELRPQQGYLPTYDQIQFQGIQQDFLQRPELSPKEEILQSPDTTSTTTQIPESDTSTQQEPTYDQMSSLYPLQKQAYQYQPQQVEKTPQTETPFYPQPPEKEKEEKRKREPRTAQKFNIFEQKSRYYATPKIWKAPTQTKRFFKIIK